MDKDTVEKKIMAEGKILSEIAKIIEDNGFKIDDMPFILADILAFYCSMYSKKPMEDVETLSKYMVASVNETKDFKAEILNSKHQ